ncbi:MerR family transcriptional regulator [Cytobacillus spongiae]|uniref:MerR family transcriptional regulator n=1 Tax=Cytobacillus spongiae TaxID=2901381 RepID=UPI0022799C01|nr:MerR family transcriptional regulator [Cytobacillus spongiae]
MGELATIANVSKRTIDYYTSLGLLKAERSQSNYRLYSKESLEDLKFIEECKLLHLPLEEIRRKLEIKKSGEIQNIEVTKHINLLTQQMKQLRKDISDLLPLMGCLDEQQKHNFSEKMSVESTALIKSLSSFKN